MNIAEKIEALISEGYDALTLNKHTKVQLKAFFHYTNYQFSNKEENAIDHLYYSVFGGNDGEE